MTDGEIVATVSQQLSWSHFVELIRLPEQRQRDFYAATAARERWSVRTLRARIAIELKTRPLEPGDFGQMTLYLRWLAANQRHEGDSTPLGIVLCTERGPEQVRLLGLDEGEVRAARYVLEPVQASLNAALAE